MNPSTAVGKSTKFPFQVAVSCWIDLLGYGEMISASRFNPLHPDARDALARIRTFHRIVAENSARYFPTLVMNDGAVAYRDLSLRARAPTHDFLVRAWQMFDAVRNADIKSGHPGPRMVLACGFRMLGRRAGLDASRGHLKSIVERLQIGEIGAEQAVREAAAMRPHFDIVPQLQANFAFTKAYVAEQSGTRGKLPGPAFYVDMMLFGDCRPPWLDLGPDIDWVHPKLSLQTVFAEVRCIHNQRHPSGGPADIRDGLAIAQTLANDPNVLAALRAASK
ncbi:hypothetical protein [Rhizobium sp. 11_C7_N12_5]|uniref:hypothetical protein n=1 Tax=Rhizobium sp. 11_C7_N12_5 TaxID=3240770 RepID=UPI003F210D69